jgi:hypothetical protein
MLCSALFWRGCARLGSMSESIKDSILVSEHVCETQSGKENPMISLHALSW